MADVIIPNGTEPNGTESRIAGITVQAEPATNGKGKGKSKSKKPKSKVSRWMTLFNTSRDNTSGKGKVKGFVPTDEGDIDVTLKCFPSDLTDEAYIEGAEGSGITVSYDLEGRKLAGVHLEKATETHKGDAALNWLEKVAETESTDDDDAQE